MGRKKISTTVYLTPEQNEQLKRLHEATKVPVAVYIREGIDLVLEKYRHALPGEQLELESLFQREDAGARPAAGAPPSAGDENRRGR